MPSQPPNTLRSNEQPDVTISFPEVSGIQSEMPLDDIEAVGFADVFNILFRKGTAQTRPGLVMLDPGDLNPAKPFVGLADFFNYQGNRFQTAMTPTLLHNFAGNAWVALTGTPMTGLDTDLFTWTVVGGKLCFCQGVDKVQLWDGVTAGFAPASVNAVPARYLFELDNHLLAGYTTESGNAAPQRWRWTGAGDPTDWTSFNAGQNDLFNDLGPITGGLKLFQQGYWFQQRGITQVIPTGNGLVPFRTESLSAHSKGNICPHSLAAFGEDTACYVGKDNIYSFNGTYSNGIGDAPLQGTRRYKGARTKIYNDIKQSDLSQIVGFISTSVGGADFNAYWLLIPPNNIWIYNFAEDNWTRVNLSVTQGFPKVIGDFTFGTPVRWQDAVGAWSAQTKTWDFYRNNDPLDKVAVGYPAGTSAVIDFVETIEQPWFIQSGKSYYNDKRHTKTVTKFLLKLDDLAPINLTMSVVNDKGETDSQTKLVGTGSGQDIRTIFEFGINGEWIQWTLSGDANPTMIHEIKPVYDVGGEIIDQTL